MTETESTLSLTNNELRQETSHFLGFGRYGTVAEGLSANQYATVASILESAQRKVYGAHNWWALRPETTIVAWVSTTGSFPQSAGTDGQHDANPYTTFTSATSTFVTDGVTTDDTLVISVTGDNGYATVGTYAISSVESETELLLTTACGGTGAETGITFYIGYTTRVVDTTNAPFYPAMVGHTITADTSGNEYTITSYTSSSVVTVDSTALADAGDTFAITATGDYRLPAEVSEIDGTFMFATDQAYHQIPKTSTQRIRRLREFGTHTGKPLEAAIKPLATPSTTGQRHDLMLWPIPDSDYTLYYRYFIAADALSADAEYPYGGSMFAELILQCCLYLAEKRITRTQGGQYNDYVKLLEETRIRDARAFAPDNLGYNADPSVPPDRRIFPTSIAMASSQVVQYEGGT
jgi:hypothetical protein